MRRRAVTALAGGVAVCAFLASGAGGALTAPAVLLVDPMNDAPGKTVDTLVAVFPTQSATLAAASVSVYAPAGYTLNLSFPPGSKVGTVVAGTTFTPADLTVADPATVTTDPCAPGTHAAVWQATVTISGQPTVMHFFVDPTTGDEAARGAYRITYCQTTPMIFLLSGVVTSPTAPGVYTWRAFVTPPGVNGAPPDPNAVYELRAIVPLPYVVTAKASYAAKTHTLAVSGRVIGGTAPQPGATVVVERMTGTKLSKLGTAVSRADGSYSIKKAIRQKKTPQTLNLEVAATVPPGPCTAPPLAPAGCLEQTDAETIRALVARIPKLPPKPKPKPKKR